MEIEEIDQKGEKRRKESINDSLKVCLSSSNQNEESSPTLRPDRNRLRTLYTHTPRIVVGKRSSQIVDWRYKWEKRRKVENAISQIVQVSKGKDDSPRLKQIFGTWDKDSIHHRCYFPVIRSQAKRNPKSSTTFLIWQDSFESLSIALPPV